MIKIQKRNFFRTNITISLKCFLLGDNDRPIRESETTIVSKDLSASGILVVANKQPLPVKTNLFLEIPLSKDDVIKVYACVARTNVEDHPDGGKIFLTAMHFLQIEEIDQRKIINYLNSKTLEARNRRIRR